ncbi:MAG: tetraacyldisaccharide 4'-kinase [Pseudomonadota bacterium]
MRKNTPPDFWWPTPEERKSFKFWLKSGALFPASLIYGRVVAGRMAENGADPEIPVVCVGNFVAGGAGKTPTALALYDVFEDLGLTPAFVTRGYGGRLATTSFRVDPFHNTAQEVGDEPLLLAEKGPTFVGPERLTSIASAAKFGATCVLFDDGLQNPAIRKSLTFAVVDAAHGVGNGLCHPAGPLRASVRDQMPFVDVVIVVGKGNGAQTVVREAAKQGKPILPATLTMDVQDRLRDAKIVAYSGIGHPDKFFKGLREEGLDVVTTHSFPDHHMFQDEDADRLLASAEKTGAQLVTTQKDAVRLARQDGKLAELDIRSTAVSASLTFEDPAYVRSLLRTAISRWRRDLRLIEIS